MSPTVRDDLGLRGEQAQADVLEVHKCGFKQLVPRWATKDACTAYDQLVQRFGPCVVLAHSQRGVFALRAYAAACSSLAAPRTRNATTSPPCTTRHSSASGATTSTTANCGPSCTGRADDTGRPSSTKAGWPTRRPARRGHHKQLTPADDGSELRPRRRQGPAVAQAAGARAVALSKALARLLSPASRLFFSAGLHSSASTGSSLPRESLGPPLSALPQQRRSRFRQSDTRQGGNPRSR